MDRNAIRIHCLFALEDLQRLLKANPPPGVSAERIVSFLLRHQDNLLKALMDLVEAQLQPGNKPAPATKGTGKRQPRATARSTVFEDEDEADPEGRGVGEILEDFLTQLKNAMTAAHPEIRERYLAGAEYDGEHLKRAFPSTTPIVSELLLAAEEVTDFPDGKGDSAGWEAVQTLVSDLRQLRQPASLGKKA